MKSLLSNYFSRLKTIEDNCVGDETLSDSEETIDLKRCRQRRGLDELKYIDDSDSMDSVPNLMSERGDYDFDHGNSPQLNQSNQEGWLFDIFIFIYFF